MQPDLIIIGSGMGGATYAAALAPSGKKILILERGSRLEPSIKDRDAKAIFSEGYFSSSDQWYMPNGRAFSPGNYACVGGNSKMYGCALIRFRKEDFHARAHQGGLSHDWPLSYEELEPFYGAAETLYQVRGDDENLDATEPPRSHSYSFPAVPHEPDLLWLESRLVSAGLHPRSIPLGLDLETWLQEGKTPWDGYPGLGLGKMDAETCGLNKALTYSNVKLKTGWNVEQLMLGKDGRISSLRVMTPEGPQELRAPAYVLAAGAVQSAALLLKSANSTYSRGLANSSDQVGRNFMNHNASAIMALHPNRRNRSVYQKTLMLNDYYHDSPNRSGPLGNIQMLGKISTPILQANIRWMGSSLANWITSRSFDFYAMSEDLPSVKSRVSVKEGQIILDWQRTNWEAHRGLVKIFSRVLRNIGFPFVVSRTFDSRTPSHQCGTARMGHDPRNSVINAWGQSHDHPNLIIADASSFVTSAAVNPALTIAALALRSADALLKGRIAV